MKIYIEPECMARLMTVATLTSPQEFSGLGFCEMEGDTIRVYDYVLLDIGTSVFTEIPVSELLKLTQRPDYSKMKAWIHFHPLGNGVPGKHNWSGTDEATIQQTPLGGLPEMVKWSVSLVLTPGGWVGRIDNYLTHKTLHLEVFPSLKSEYDAVMAVHFRKQAEKEEQVAQIEERVLELPDEFLRDLGMEREDLFALALEKAGIHDYYGDQDILNPSREGYNGWDEYDYRFPPREVTEAQRRLSGPSQA
jgi:hypothetical protein